MPREDSDALEVGTFEVTSGKIIVKDPCYDDAYGSTFPAKNGTWIGIIHVAKGRSARVSAIEARAAGYRHNTLTEVCREGVDSGQMGVFDSSKADASVEDDYEDICTMTLKTPYGGIIKQYGVVSGTAYGDGEYPVMVSRDLSTGEVTSVLVEFEAPDDSDGDYPDEDEFIEDERDEDPIEDDK